MQVSGNRVAVEGALTLDTAAAVLDEGRRALSGVLVESDSAVVDLANAVVVDSSALAVIFAWMRDALRAGKSLSLANPSPALLSLASVYGVGDMLPLA